ncbi:MAG: DUF2461 domain-containing protein [Chitinophagaceae bacterium]|nr:MAG: DUF2461 domain-containing protein [Chitinophagaceae bacterium]
MFQPNTIKFLRALAKNNNKPWMDANRGAFETAKADYAGFIQQAIDAFGKKEPKIANLVAKDCMFRINRDIRFAKDKSPYKTNLGASINQGGKKSPAAGYYFHLQPGQSFTGGGVWMPEPADLKKIRQEIDYNLKEFNSIVTSKSFRKVYGELASGDEYKLSRVPKGYEPDNPGAEYIKLKSFLGTLSLTDAQLTDKSLLKTTVNAFEALKPLVDFLNQAMEI